MAQLFKGDETELKMQLCASGILENLRSDKITFWNQAYETAGLGEIIYDSGRSPLANAIDRDIFRLAFKQIFESFVTAGTFESYITVFQKIFGEDVEITFTVPAPGKLNIDIVAEGVEESPFMARYIEDNSYILDNVVDDLTTPDNIVFQTVQGFQSQYELEQMLFEMVPAGIFTTITLTLGGA